MPVLDAPNRPPLLPNLSVAENIAVNDELGAPFALAPRQAMRAAARAALASLDAHLPLDAPVGRLNVAERQIVAICRGLAAKARILFMDEPTASLTNHEVELLLDVVRRLKNLGIAVVFVCHRLEEVAEIAERVTVLRDGRKVTTTQARDMDDHRVAELMTGSRFEYAVPVRRSVREHGARGQRRDPRRRVRRRVLRDPCAAKCWA